MALHPGSFRLTDEAPCLVSASLAKLTLPKLDILGFSAHINALAA
jgi:hypothetical protein